MKNYKNFIIFFILILAILLFFLKKYNDIIAQNRTDTLVSKNIEIIQNELSYQKKHALSLAILFSNNQNIIDALNSQKRAELKSELNYLLKNIKNYTDIKNIQIQVHTKELKVFVRSWEDKDTGLDLTAFRKGLVRVKETKQPFVSNELGKRLNIKAIAPIFNKKGSFIGSIEVIMDYSSIKKRLKFIGIDILPVLDKKHLNIAIYHQNNQTLFEYVLLESEYDKKLYDLVSHNEQIFLNDRVYYDISDKLITLIPLRDMDTKDVGFIITSFNKTNDSFNYLPKYEYSGNIPTNSNYPNQTIIKKREVIIK